MAALERPATELVQPLGVSCSLNEQADSTHEAGTHAPRATGNTATDAQRRFSFWRLLQFSGPGLLMAIAYIDPGNLEADLQAGAQAGLRLAWVTLWATILGFFVQLLSMRIGVVTRTGLAEQCKAVYPRAPRILLWLMVEVAIIGADIQEVIGSAIAIQLLTQGRVPLWAGVLITGADTFCLLLLERLGVRKLEALFGALVATMVVAFGIMYGRAHVPTTELLLNTVVPHASASQLSLISGLLGSMVMPHNFYLISAIVHSRKLASSENSAKKEALLYHTIESGSSLVVTVFINLFVTAVFAVGFHQKHRYADIGLSTAGRYLGERFGTVMKYIWAVGLLAAGQSSTMIGTYTGQFVMEGFTTLRISALKRALITRSVALAPTLAFAIAYANNDKLDSLAQALNVLQSFQLPFALLPLLHVSTRRAIMGSFVARGVYKWIAFAICAVLLGLNMWSGVQSSAQTLRSSVGAGAAVIAALVLYFAFVGYLCVGPRRVGHLHVRCKSAALRRLLQPLASAEATHAPGAVQATMPSLQDRDNGAEGSASEVVSAAIPEIVEVAGLPSGELTASIEHARTMDEAHTHVQREMSVPSSC